MHRSWQPLARPGDARKRPADLAAPQVDEHVVAVDCQVLAVQVIGIQAHQRRTARDDAQPPALGVRPFRVRPRQHLHLTRADIHVLVPQPQYLADAHPGIQQERARGAPRLPDGDRV